MNLAEAMTKFPTIPASHCLSCHNSWFFDRGRRLTCTTCGADRPLYEISEQHTMSGFGSTSAVISADSLDGLKRGVEHYLKEYPVMGYSTIQGEILAPTPGVFVTKMVRLVTCD